MNIIRYYNQNREFIWTIIIAIIIIIIAIQVLNGMVKDSNTKIDKINYIKEEYENNLPIDVLLSDQQVKENKELIIDQFIRYCNSNKTREAYNLLTNECKEELFQTLDLFEKNYHNKIFTTTKLYSKERYYSKTYKIKYYEDVLSTGNINTATIEDYYTIQYEDDVAKINIGNYIKKKQLNKKYKNNNIQIKVNNKQVYKDYEKYEIEIENLSDKTILLDSKENTKSVYLIGKKEVKYYSLLHEVVIDNLIINPKQSKNITIKFNKEYNSNNEINQIVFSDIITDYEKYKNENIKSNYKDRNNIAITI